MRAEIIAVGTELLMGDVVNTNATWLSKALAAIGVDVYHHVSVGDNPERIQKVLATAIDRAEVILFTGGLGPTDDDLTIATLADYFQAEMISDPDSVKRMEEIFAARGLSPMPVSNLKQALRPASAETLHNPSGTAPGILWDVSEHAGKPTFLMTFPGVPKELHTMWPQAQAYIQRQQRAHNEPVQLLVSEFINFFGISESLLAENLRDLMQTSNPTVAPYVGGGMVRIRIAAKAMDETAAEVLIAPVRAEIIQRCHKHFIGTNDDTLEGTVGALLKAKNLRLTVAESCTGGLISSRLTDVSGSSAYIFGNVVTYSNEEKTRLLNVPPALFVQHGSVSPEVASSMAIGALARADETEVPKYGIALAITGIAGPNGGSDAKPVGLAYLGIAQRDRSGKVTVTTQEIRVNARYQRPDIKHWFSQHALAALLQTLKAG